MPRSPLFRSISRALALAPLIIVAGTAIAAPAPQQTAPPSAAGTTTLAPTTVTAIVYRDRTEAVVPTLVYDLEYFQRFEPLTVGDMLKRVPSVGFLSDVLEYDGVRLRGLDPGYTQILINGERVPGAGFDRSFFVDRIPAELVERIEIVRSASADRSGDAIAGTLNIVLRDGYSLDGGYLRAGLLYFDNDGVSRGLGGAVWGGAAGPGQLLLGVNVQGRRNPKDKFSARFDEPFGTLIDIEDQTDVRNGVDTALNASWSLPTDTGSFAVNAFFVRTDRLEDEDSIEYRSGVRDDANLLTLNDNNNDIVTDNWSIDGTWRTELAGGDTRFRVGYARFEDEQREFENDSEFLRDTLPFPELDRYTADRDVRDLADREFTADADHERALGDATKLKFGIQYTGKRRDTDFQTARSRVTIPNASALNPTLPTVFTFAPVSGAINRIEEDRTDPFVKLSGGADRFEWETGVRWQRTKTTIDDRTVPAAEARNERTTSVLLPSASLRFALSDADRLTASVARTMRRPGFDQISPALLLAEFGDNDFVGNPDLEPEKAWGFDLGYERRLGRQGIVGVNTFYRDISDLIELASLDVGSEGPGTFLLSPRNTGDGTVWGIEFDLSTPLDAFGLPDTGVFVNYSWLDSEVEDVFGDRRFNDQARSIYNVGFIHDLVEFGGAFGASYRKQGEAFGRIVGAEVTTSYGADLEAFVEKRFGEQFTLRFTGSNLLNASKDETFETFTTIADQRERSYDGFELESEQGGRVYYLIARYTF